MLSREKLFAISNERWWTLLLMCYLILMLKLPYCSLKHTNVICFCSKVIIVVVQQINKYNSTVFYEWVFYIHRNNEVIYDWKSRGVIIIVLKQ